MDALNRLAMDPRYQDLFSILRGTRNGVVYGAKLRFCHALVMSVLFRKGPIKSRVEGILRATYQHAKALGLFVFIYKSVLTVLGRLRQGRTGQAPKPRMAQIRAHENPMDAFWAGLIGGYIVFGRNSPAAAGNTIAQQMALYVFSRIILGGAKYITEDVFSASSVQASKLSNASWTVMASLSWAIVMYLFRADPKVLQSSMLHSLKYLYVDSESWNSIFDFF